MRCLLAVVAKDGPLDPGLLPRGQRAAQRCVPVVRGAHRGQQWVSPSGAGALLTWDDEDGAGLVRQGEDALAWSGELDGGPADVLARLARAGTSETERALRATGGTFALALARGGSDTVTVAGTAVPTVPIHLAEDDRYRYAADRASLLALLLAAPESRPRYDLEALVPLLLAGFPTDDRTMFAGVRALPAGCAAVLSPAATSVVELYPDGDAQDVGEVADAVAGRLRDVVSLLPRVPAPRCTLTGGHDSRLVLAALSAAGVPATCSTAGSAGSPDVTVAAGLARLVGLPHEVEPLLPLPVLGGEVVVDVLARACGTVLLGEGVLSAYENVGLPAGGWDPAPVLGGHGGEVLRGGFATYTSDHSPAGVRKYLRRQFFTGTSLVREQARTGYSHALAARAAAAAESPEPARVLEELYRTARAGRWTAAARGAYRHTQRLDTPLLDNLLTQAVARAPFADRASGRLGDEVLRRLAPDLLDVPYADGSGAPDWRGTPSPDLRDAWREQVLDGARSSLFDVVDRAAAEELLGPGGRPQVAWRLYTVSVLLADAWLDWLPPSRVVVAASATAA